MLSNIRNIFENFIKRHFGLLGCGVCLHLQNQKLDELLPVLFFCEQGSMFGSRPIHMQCPFGVFDLTLVALLHSIHHYKYFHKCFLRRLKIIVHSNITKRNFIFDSHLLFSYQILPDPWMYLRRRRLSFF